MPPRSGGALRAATPQVKPRPPRSTYCVSPRRNGAERLLPGKAANVAERVEAKCGMLCILPPRRTTCFRNGRNSLRQWHPESLGRIAGTSGGRKYASPRAPSAESTLFGVVETIGSFFKRRKLFRSAGAKPEPGKPVPWNCCTCCKTDPQFFLLFSRLDLSDPAAVEAEAEQSRRCRDQVLQSPYASGYLEEAVLA